MHGAVGIVIVSQLLLLQCVKLLWWLWLLCCILLWLQSLHHMQCHGHDHHAAWCYESVVSGLKKRELAEKEKRKHTSRGKPAQAQ